jgi:multiple sugar transport system substrate-binding protein
MPMGPASEQARNTEPCVQAPPFGLSISAFAENPDAAWLLVQWLTSKEAQLDYLKAGRVAARQSAWDSPEFVESITPEAAPYWEAQAVASQYCYPTPGHAPDSIKDVTRSRDIIGQVITTAILGGDIEAAANAAQEELEMLRAREQADS